LLDAIFECDGVKAVQAKQVLDELIFAQTLEGGIRPIAQLGMKDREHAFETLAVHRGDDPNELFGTLAGLARRLIRVEARE
jgi:hypothetical protein